MSRAREQVCACTGRSTIQLLNSRSAYISEFALMMLQLFLMALLLALIPIGFSVLIYLFIKRQGYNKRWHTLATLPLLGAAYMVYSAFYPGNSFYENEFTTGTGLTLPESTTINFKSSTYPDFHGDYSSTFIAVVGEDFYDELSTVLPESGFTFSDQEMTRYDKFLGEKNFPSTISALCQYTRHDDQTVYIITLLNDERSILVQSISW